MTLHNVLNLAFTLTAMVAWGTAGYQLAKFMDEKAYAPKTESKRQKRARALFLGGVLFVVLAFLFR